MALPDSLVALFDWAMVVAIPDSLVAWFEVSCDCGST